jgi:DNA-binding IclR family transcriptional regulator
MDDFDKDREKNKYLIPNIARALKILDYLACHKNEASITEISSNFGIPKNSVFRILNTLGFYGYVEEENRKYQATPRLLYLGYAGMRTRGIIENSLDMMHALRDELNETVMIGTLFGNQIVIVEQFEPFQNIKFSVEIGKRVTLHASAPGKAILAFLPEDERQTLLNQVTFTRYTDSTLPSKSAMARELEKVREKGYAIDDGEELKEIHCAGCPIFDYRGYPVASIWVAGPAFRFTRELFDKFGPVVREHAMAISRRFGYDPGEY